METTEIQAIALSQIQPNPLNPRRVITPDMVNAMAASLKAVGLNNPVKVIAQPDGTYELISGHIRLAGAQQLEWDSIPALVLTRTPQQALLEAILDNRGQQMSWLETYEAIETLLNTEPKPTQQEVADQLGVSQDTVSRAFRLLNTLTPAARTLLYEQFVKLADEAITQRAVFALTALVDPHKVEEALKVAIEKKMTEPQAKALVASMKTGTPAHAHVVTPRTKKAIKAFGSSYSEPTPGSDMEPEQPKHASRLVGSNQASTLPPELEDLVVELPAPRTSSSAHPHTPKPVSLPQTGSMGTGGTSSSIGTGTTKAHTSAGSLSAGETAVWDAMAGISVISQIKTKIKKGKRPNLVETLLLAGHGLWSILAWVGKHGFKLVKAVGKEVWKVSKDGIKITLKFLGKTIRNLLAGLIATAVLALLAWFVYEFLTNGHHPRAALMDIGKTLVDWAILLWKQG